MKGGTRKRGKTWSYYFDAAAVGGKRKKLRKEDFVPRKKPKPLLQKPYQNTIEPEQSLSHQISALEIIWMNG